MPHRPPPPHDPPHRPPRHGPRHAPGSARRHLVPASQLLSFVDEARLDRALAALIPGDADRAFVCRCIVGEGPIHHRGANYVLMMLLTQLQHQLVPGAVPPRGEKVPMRLPPHLGERVVDGNYPLQLPTAALAQLAQGDEAQLRAMVDCLTDGPPQHALANVIIVALAEQLLGHGPAGPDGA